MGKKNQTLRDVLPEAFFDEFQDSRANKYLDRVVVSTHEYGGWRGTHRNVINWWTLEGGILVGWNENPAIGWSFPVMRQKQD